MRAFYLSVSCACVLGTTLLSACADGSPTGASVEPRFRSQLTRSQSHARPNAYPGDRHLYVADFATQSIKILDNKSYRELGQITTGIANPNSIFLDTRGNLYVANGVAAPSVTEYPPNATTPSFTYNNEISESLFVTADVHGNVYVIDDAAGYVWQYFQGSNSPVARCSPGASMFGVAVDSANDVFVALAGGLVEYAGGLSGCNATPLGASIGHSYGMTVDKQNDLVVCDAASGQVDVIAPPYSSVTRAFGTNLVEPSSVTLSRNNTMAFVADYKSMDVQVYDFQTGALIKTLGTVYGLLQPTSAVDGPNAVY